MISARTVRNVTYFVAIIFTLTTISPSSEEARVSIYSVIANYSVPVTVRNGQLYTSLLDVIDPLGTVSATTEGPRWRLRYNNQQAEFTAGSNHARVRQSDFDLRANFVLENERGLVPLSTLGPLMSHILGGPVTFHEASRRVFVGSVAIHFTAQVSKNAPRSLVMNFTARVNPMIATEPGKLHMVFSHEPVVEPGSPALTFDDAVIPSAIFSEDNGAAEVTVNGTAPLFASFSNGNRTITITPAPLVASKNASPAPGQESASSNPGGPTPTPQSPAAATATPSSTQVFAIIDASHGGSERGEALTDQLAEKDITLAFARALRQELQSRGITTLVLRDGDATLTTDQRASQANVAHPAIYICLHATSQGRGVRLYTALLPSGRNDAGPFFDWDTAQSEFLPLSRATAAGMASELQKKQIPVRVLMAPLRPLNSVTTAAVAVEVAPSSSGVADFNSPAYQQLVASGVAAGVLSVRSRLETGR